MQGDADADGDRVLGELYRQHQRLDPRSDALGQNLGVPCGVAAEKYGELHAAEPDGYIGLPAAGQVDFGHGLQRFVSGQMPVGVVDLLEVIDVAHQQRDATSPLAFVQTHHPRDRVLDVKPRVQAGQRIAYRLLMDLLALDLETPVDGLALQGRGERSGDLVDKARGPRPLSARLTLRERRDPARKDS